MVNTDDHESHEWNIIHNFIPSLGKWSVNFEAPQRERDFNCRIQWCRWCRCRNHNNVTHEWHLLTLEWVSLVFFVRFLEGQMGSHNILIIHSNGRWGEYLAQKPHQMEEEALAPLSLDDIKFHFRQFVT